MKFAIVISLLLSVALSAPVHVNDVGASNDIKGLLRFWSQEVKASIEPSESPEIPLSTRIISVPPLAKEISSYTPQPSKISIKVPDASITPFAPVKLNLLPSASVYVSTPLPSFIPLPESAVKPEPSVLPAPSLALSPLDASDLEIAFASPEESILPTAVPSPTESVIPDDATTKKDAACLPADAQVRRREDGTINTVNIANIRIGDLVEDSPGTFAPIIAWTHKRTDVESFMVEVSTNADGSTGHITTSAGHYFMVDGSWVVARELEIGSKLRGHSITSIKIKRKNGLFNPQTSSGLLLARTGGINSDFLQVTTYTEALHPMVAHAALAPVRACPQILSHVPLVLAEFSFSLQTSARIFENAPAEYFKLLVESLFHSAM